MIKLTRSGLAEILKNSEFWLSRPAAFALLVHQPLITREAVQKVWEEVADETVSD